ncbi:heavy-metal-associated domain-containing protein [uncultured Eubacterium sp.]|uniref:heavy-metal-associated domain-containing protein n=1 Tax=uncultured Eubacterium sp. TaxID=165185 RepID=UPI002639E576|nr:heavy-metal-associated domain-containing protein [uncultured Eubacterium sp.]
MIKTTLGIDGMMCGMCESHMNDAIRNNFKVKKVNSSHVNKTTEIISEGQLDEDKLKQVVADTGYTMTSINTEEYEKKGFSLFHRN